MKKILCTFLLMSLLAAAQPPGPTYTLAQINDGPALLRGPISFTIGSHAYAGLGWGDWAPVQNYYVYKYTPATDTWSPWNAVPAFPGLANQQATAFSANNMGYVVGGFKMQSQDVYSNELWQYDEATNSWTQKTSFPGAARAYAVGFVIGANCYYGMGGDGTTKFTDFYVYDALLDTWQPIAPFPGVWRNLASGFSIGSKGYLVGGAATGLNTVETWEYDASSDTWTQRADVSAGTKSGGVGFALNGKGYYGFGYTFPTGTVNDFYEYNPVTDAWNNIYGSQPPYTPSSVLCYQGTAFVHGNRAYFGMGMQYSNDTDRDMYKFGAPTYTPPSVGIKSESMDANDCALYPNPTQADLHINCASENMSYTVSDVYGRMILSGKLERQGTVMLNGFPKGIYLLCLQNEQGQRLIKKIVLGD